jgi:hypothetical protein
MIMTGSVPKSLLGGKPMKKAKGAKKWEGSAEDKKMDKKLGIKENDKRDKKMDKAGQAKFNKMAGKKK